MRNGMSPTRNRQSPGQSIAPRASMAAPSRQAEIWQSKLLLLQAVARRTGSAQVVGAAGTLRYNTRDRCWTIGDQSKRARLNQSKAGQVDLTPDRNIRVPTTA